LFKYCLYYDFIVCLKQHKYKVVLFLLLFQLYFPFHVIAIAMPSCKRVGKYDNPLSFSCGIDEKLRKFHTHVRILHTAWRYQSLIYHKCFLISV